MTERPPLPEDLGPLNPAQAEAVLHLDGPLLILAGAGSGKTRVLTRRIAYMLHVGIDPESILAVTFTNKAAAEMKERVAELVGAEGRKVWVSTFHASCCRILRSEAEALGYTTRFAIYDDDDQSRVVRQIVLDLGYDPKEVVPKAILSQIDHFKNRRIGVKELVAERRGHTSQALVKIWEAYEDQLRAADAMDFNDLINKVVELFEEHLEIRDAYRDKFKYVLVDEYQDTNRAQYRLLRLLTEAHRNLSVVGDDDQSIYGFRGADIRNILDFEADFPDAKVVRMEQNYRCTERILAVANAVVAKNTDRIDKKLWTETKQGGARVSFLVHDDPRAEARFVANAISQLRLRGVMPEQVAVIYRTNATSQPLESAMREAGLPYKLVGGRKFYTRREIRDALSYLRVITNPADDAAFLRVVNVPPRGIGAVSIGKIRKAATERGEPLLKTARSFAMGSDRLGQALNTFVGIVDELVEVSKVASLPAFLQQVLERSGYTAMLRAEDSHESKDRINNLTQLLRDAASHEPEDPQEDRPEELLQSWLDRVSLAGADEELPEGGEVTLMTVHNSKGLEYPYVFVVNMVEGQFPHSRSAEEPGGVDEERRLAYVAFTRAQERLFISRCRNQLQFDRGKGSLKPVAPSRFLFGIPLDACDGAPPRPEDEDEGGQIAGYLRPAPPSEEHTAQVRALVERARQRRQVVEVPPELPEDEYRTRPVSSPDDLSEGTRVLHERFGVGEVVGFRPPTVSIMFKLGIQRIGMSDPRLQILRD